MHVTRHGTSETAALVLQLEQEIPVKPVITAGIMRVQVLLIIIAALSVHSDVFSAHAKHRPQAQVLPQAPRLHHLLLRALLPVRRPVLRPRRALPPQPYVLEVLEVA